MPLDRLRIFISSPGDVAEERVLANNLVRRLSDEFESHLRIEPVFWEHEPLLATSTFQAQIPPPRECEVAVCILWSRLGTRLPADITRPDGTRYASGTEYEFEDAANGFRDHGKPQLLVYRKTATPMADLSDRPALLRRLEQKDALDGFIQKWFFNTDGTLKNAFHEFASPSDFEKILEEHLRKLIQRAIPTNIVASAPAKISWTAGSPFRGLDVFEVRHAPVFFGRSQAVGDLIGALRTNMAVGRAFALVVGVSGGGKSSLVRAGVLPLLTQPGVIEGVALWRRAILKPSDADSLLRALAGALLQPDALPELGADGTTADQLADLLRQNPAAAFPLIKGGLSQAAAAVMREQNLSAQPEARLVIVADQLEELFTLRTATPAERQAFIAALSALARSGRVAVIATLRGDFYHRAFELPELVALQEGSGQYALPLPTPAEIAQMIRQPARAAGLTFEEDPRTHVSLDEQLREAATASPESLPLLEFALEELYQRRTQTGLLTYAAYKELGGVEGALAQRAETVFASLAPEVQETLPRVMRALVNVEGDAIARQQAPLESAAPTPLTRLFVEAFVQARLFSADRTDAGQATVRVTHEALLRNWPRVVKWLEQDRERLIVRARVSAAAARWMAEGKPTDLLLGEGKPLAEAENLAATLGDELAPADRALIAASQRRRRSRMLLKRTAFAALSVLTIIAAWAAVAARHNASRADANAKRAVIGEAAAMENAAKALERLAESLVSQGDSLALAGRVLEARATYQEAYAKFGDAHASPFRAEMAIAMINADSPPPLLTFTGHSDYVNDVAISPDGLTALSANGDDTLKLWDMATGTEVRTFRGHTGPVLCVAVSPDGHTALSGSEDKTLKLWDMASGREVRTLEGQTGSILSVAFSPDGRTALTGNFADTATLWDVASGIEIRTLQGHESSVNSVALSPDGRTGLSGSNDNTLKLWDLASGNVILTLAGHSSGVKSVVFSPDGRTALSGSQDKTLKLWDLASGKEIRTLQGHTDTVRSIAFSPDGRTALSGSQDKTLKLWDLASGKEIRTLAGHADNVTSVAFGPDGRTALSGSDDKTLKLWDLTSGQGTRTLRGHPGYVASVSFGPDGRTALSGGLGETIKLWDLASGMEMQALQGHTGAVSPDGRSALLGTGYSELKLWDLETGKEIRSLKGHTAPVECIVFSPDGRTALSGSDDNTLRFWDLASGTEMRTLRGHTGGVTSVAFSPNGRTALSGSGDKTLRLWDLASGNEIRALRGHTDGVTSVAISPDGRAALSGSYDKTLKLWDLTSGEEIRTLQGHISYVDSTAFSPDGHTALSGSYDRTLKLWDLASGKEIRTLEGHTEGVSSVAFSPDGRAALSGSGDKTVKFWDFGRGSIYLAFENMVPNAQAALQKNPNDATALVTLGNWYAFRRKNDWAADFLERARARGGAVDPLTLGRCYWELSGDLPPNGHFTAAEYRAASLREYRTALARTHDALLSTSLGLCADAIANTVGDEFWFDTDFVHRPTQHWRRVDAQHWHSDGPNGASVDFVTVDPALDNPCIVRRLPDKNDFEFLIPQHYGEPIAGRKVGSFVWSPFGIVRNASQPSAPSTSP